MVRFFATCLVLAAGCVAAVVLSSNYFHWTDPVLGNGKEREKESRPIDPDNPDGDREPPVEPRSASGSTATPSLDRPVRLIECDGQGGMVHPLVIQDGRVLPLERQEVPSERDGKLLLLATPVSDTEFVPKDKEVRLEVPLLGVEWRPGDEQRPHRDGHRRPVIREPFEDPANPGKLYRFPRPGDSLAPGSTRIVRLPIRFRKLEEDDEVEKDQLLGVINPAVALEELAIKQSKVESAAADVRASSAMREESVRRLASIQKSRSAVRGSVSDDDYGAAKVTVDRYVNEEVAKKAAVVQAQQELSGAWTNLELFFIRAAIPGRIRTIYKHQGEAVKNLDPVMQLQNTRKMRVEAQIEVQDALPLQERIRRAEQMRIEARAFDQAKPEQANELRRRADALTAVQVEVTRPVPPKAVLSGHLQEVTCVAVTRGPLPRIVSGSEEGLVRIWERVPGDDRWQERVRLDHGVPLRALACTGAGAKKNLMVSATSRGQVRIFDLDAIKNAPITCGTQEVYHQGAVHAIAITSDGEKAATAGEDRSICLWDLRTGALILRKKGAHNSTITSLAFTPTGRLVSAGRDKRLAVWKVNESSLDEIDEVTGRSGEVATLGLDPKGEQILFDEGRELRILSLNTRRIEGSLMNPGATGAFSTLALFSPDGRTILTNGNGPGRLQLWRSPSAKNRAAELRQFLWSTGTITSGAFDPSGNFAVTGTSDHRVLVWDLPRKEEAEKPFDAQLTYVEQFLDTGLKRLTIRATMANLSEGVNPGSTATIVVPPAPAPVPTPVPAPVP